MDVRRSMHWRRLRAVLLACCACSVSIARGAERSPEPIDRDRLYAELEREVTAFEARHNVLKTVVKLVNPTVVHIQWRSTGGYSRQSGKQREVEEAGSGVVFEFRGQYFALTNWHVVRDAELSAIEVSFLDGRQARPAKLWKDTATDVCVLALEESDLIAARLGNSDELEIGDFVLAVGSPFGLDHSVTYGIISAKGRRQLELGEDTLRFQDFLQTDAAINPGNSGGPLVNLRGEVVGLNTAIASSSGANDGVGFSIPINMAMTIARQLIEHGKVTRAFLGVTLDKNFGPATATRLGMSRARGAHVTQITPGSAAEQARLEIDDVIVEFNHVPIDDDDHLVTIVSLTEVGKEVPLVVVRGGQERTLSAVVGDRAEHERRTETKPVGARGGNGGGAPGSDQLDLSSRDAWDIDVLGITVVDSRPSGAPASAPDRELVDGLLVTRVDPAGPCAEKVEAGEVIDQIERVAIHGIDDLERALSTANLSGGVNLRVVSRRDGRNQRRQIVVQPNLSVVE